MKTIKLPVFKNCDPNEESVLVDFYDVSDEAHPSETICRTRCPLGEKCLGMELKNGTYLENNCTDSLWLDFSKIDMNINEFAAGFDEQTGKAVFSTDFIPSREVFEVALENDPKNLKIIKEQYDTFGEAKGSIIR